MQREKRTKAEIEGLILEKLRTVPGCETIEESRCIRSHLGRPPRTGRSVRAGVGMLILNAATKALPSIIAEMSRRYELTAD